MTEWQPIDLSTLLERVRAADEGWRPIPGLPYSASSKGRIRSDRTGKVLRSKITPKGYEVLMLQVDYKRYNARVHRLVFQAWSGPIPDGLTVNHIDGDKRNNCPCNLEAITCGDNTRHASRLGLMASGDRNGARANPNALARGEANGSARLNADAVIKIRSLIGSASYSQIAEMFGVSKSTVFAIMKGKSWQHI